MSAHYMDDTTIIIKQNRCFKEVIKELELYGQATEARVNWGKTKGLWVGSWKGRRVSPLNIKWTSGVVKNLGVYFGNDDPAVATFEELVPKFKKRLAYWKRFSLTKIGKATVAEMFLASKLFYAMKFYPIPQKFQKEIQDSIFDFVNFPNKVITVSQKEMWKIKINGGIKLVNVQVKSATSKAKWLLEMATNPYFRVNLDIFSSLVGVQRGDNRGRDLIFMHRAHITRTMKIDSQFYREALKSVSIFERKKGVPDVAAWDDENIFYNPLIMNKAGKTLKETEYFRVNGIFKLGQLLKEKAREARGLPFDRRVVSLMNVITLDTAVKKEDMVYLGSKREVEMSLITQKELYEDAILRTNSQDHVYQNKWVTELDSVILWEAVWESVHHSFLSNSTRTVVWEQIHLNFYTQYSYNKWHGGVGACPLCGRVPESIYHIVLLCDYTNSAWARMAPILSKLDGRPVDDAEKALGIVHIKPTDGMRLRNWLTYKLREQILDFERVGYYSSGAVSPGIFKSKFNRSVADDIKKMMYRYANEGKLEVFEKKVGYNNVLFDKIQDGEYRLKKVIT